jgi:hypothetical protein
MFIVENVDRDEVGETQILMPQRIAVDYDIAVCSSQSPRASESDSKALG